MPPPPTTFGVQSGSRGAPYNPFARTLATSEAAFGLQRPPEEQAREGTGGVGNGQRASAGRPALDVDAFKNILLTGSATPSPPTAQVRSAPQRPQDSSSSTDTSSLSRQSIFDPMHDAHPESPRTSFDDHGRSDEDDGDDEHSSLMGPISSRPVEEGPPAPPKNKHGRTYPQTVSFADFDETIPSALPTRLQTPPINTSRPSTPRSPSDLNKPLPPPPAERRSEDNARPELSQQEDASAQPTAAEAEVPAELLQAKKPPPPPPASRRRAQPDTSQGRARSTSNLSQGSTQQTDSTKGEQSLKPAPPPPPARRTQAISSETPSPAIETPPSVPSPNEQPAESKAMPPPPPRRNQAKIGTSANRTPSNASRTSLPRSDSFSASVLPTSNAPPAPPPRRGAASKRNSIDGGPPNSLATRRPSSAADNRRTSGQSFESERSVSLTSLQQVAEPGENEEAVSSTNTEKPERDIIAEMAAFQAEIDALRAKDGRHS